MRSIKKGNVIKGAVAGIIGGLIASFVMDEFQQLVTKVAKETGLADDKGSKKGEDEPSTVKAAEAVSEAVFDHKLTNSEKEPAGAAVHYAIGATSGFIYGIAAEMLPVATVGLGLPFGAAVWVAADDVAVPALGLSKPLTEYPLSTHAYALSSHLVYGLTTDLVRRAVLRVL